MPLRILHCIHSVNPAGGGPIEGVKQMSAVNNRNGHTVEVVCLDNPGDPWVRDFPLACHAMGPSYLSYGYTPRLVPWLRANRRRFDIVVVNGIWQFQSFGTWLALRGTTTPYFVFTHGMLDPWFKVTYPLKHLKKWMYWPWGDYRVLRDATAVLFTCEEERRLARKSFWLYQCDECVVNYGAPIPKGNADEERRAFLSAFPRLAGRRCLLFLGRMHVKKGPDLLLQAFARVLRQRPAAEADNLRLVMAGPNDHAYARGLMAEADRLGLSGHIVWTGMLTGAMKWGAFRASEVFILPSHQENFGISVAESLACALPVLITNKVNIWREVQLHGAGMVETDDQEGICILLERWLALSAAERASMSAAALECFRTRFDIEQTAGMFVRLLLNFGLRDTS